MLPVLGVLAAVLGVAGCSSSPDGSSSSDSAADSAGSSVVGSAADDAGGDAGGQSLSRVDAGPASAADLAQAPAEKATQGSPQQAQVISTGAVSLGAADVAGAVVDVRRIVTGYRGSVQKESTDTDEDGSPVSSNLTVRVPTSNFDAAMADLGRVATLESTSSNSKDVTTTVLDNNVRVQVAQRSIDRISALLDQAGTLRDVISIETELASRQADLASLESQQKYLADETAMATITVSVDYRDSTRPPPDDDTSGFAAGLAAGWHALGRSATAASTAVGALLPWTVVVAVVGLPLWLVRRRRRVTSEIGDPEATA